MNSDNRTKGLLVEQIFTSTSSSLKVRTKFGALVYFQKKDCEG